MPIKVLIVDDHNVVRQGIHLLLEAQPEIEVVGETSNGQETLELASRLQPDVILLDLLMPGMSGIDTIRQLHTQQSPSKILVLSSSLEDHMIVQAIKAGAHGYLLKTNRASEMLNAIKTVAQGSTSLDPAVTHVLHQLLSHHDPLDNLTPREREIFDLLSHGMNNTEIAEKLVISEVTIRTHVIHVLEKLQLRDRTQVMVFALKRGLIHPEDLP